MTRDTAANIHRHPLHFIVAAMAMSSVTYGFGRYAYGLFLPAIRQQFHLGTFQLGLLASLNTGLFMLANLIASAAAVHHKPRTFIAIGGAITTLGLLAVGCASTVQWMMTGIIIAGIGGGIYTPALFEAIEAWLPANWNARAIGAINAGSTPGLIVTGLLAYAIQSSWQLAWLAMAAVTVAVTLWNWWCMPAGKLPAHEATASTPLTLGLFLRRECLPFYIVVFVYGLLFTVYMTFAVDLILSAGGMRFPTDRLFWALLGLAGLCTAVSGPLITRFGVGALLSVTLPLCGLSYSMLALAPGNTPLVFASAILFGITSFAPGSGMFIWGIRLFQDRPSIGTGVMFLCTSMALMSGPMLFGAASSVWSLQTICLALTALSFAVLPLLPRGMFGTRRSAVPST